MRARFPALLTLTAGAALATADFSAQVQPAQPPADRPADIAWVDSLNLSQAPVRRPRGTVPPGLSPITLGGKRYEHGLPFQVNSDLMVDLKGQATAFTAMVGIDDGAPPTNAAAAPTAPVPPQGSVTFDVWVDGKPVWSSGVVRAGDAPKPVRINLQGAQRLVLAMNDAGDTPTGDNGDWADAAIGLASPVRPEVVVRQAEPAPPIAAAGSSVPEINYPRITGATPGRPFMFLIPATGDAPLTFSAKNLPAGLTLNRATGLITGSLQKAGTTVVALSVSNGKGTATANLKIVGGDHALALTPPLGWNSWNAWGNTVTAERVRASADGMVSSGLARQGYTYINIDDVWERRPSGTDPGRDATGEIETNANFPDMKGLVDYIHSQGLKAGIYSSPGPTTCQGLPATYQHEAQDARTWASWGFDYVKYDWCSYSRIAPNPTLEQRQAPYRLLRSALDEVGRDIVYSLCQYGAGNVWEWGAQVGGNLWRVTGDITDTWQSMSGIGFQQTGHEQYAGPGHWNDTDMLVVGQVGWSSGSRPTKLTPNEQITHISLWTLQAAPLIIGADLAHVDAFTVNLLGNREVLAVNQDELGRPASRIFGDGRLDIWSRPLADGTRAVGLFNRGPEPTTISVRLSDIGMSGSQPVRDLWLHKDLARATGTFSAVVARHGAVLVKIGRPQ